MRAKAVLLAIALTGIPSIARAQAPQPPDLTTTQPPATPAIDPQPIDPSQPPTVGASGPQWSKEYHAARERMVAGDFATASVAFQQLAATARHPFDRGLALELARLCQTWHQKGLVFVRSKDLGESTIRARAADERTSDEIASLYLTSVVYGLGTGAWVAVLTEPESPAGGILPALGLAAGSAGLVALVDSGRPMHYGVPQSIVTGVGLGFYEGLLFTSWNQAQSNRANEWEGEGVATFIWAAATVGALTGGIVGTVKGTTPGRASFVGSAALWSAALSGLTVGALSDDDDMQDDKALLSAAIGLNVGAVGGMFAAGPASPSIARVRYLDLGGMAGGLLFAGLYVSAADDESEASAFMTAGAAGIATGLVTSWFLTDGMEADRGYEDDDEPPKAALEIRPTLVPMPGGMGLGFYGVL